jgi:putative ABC transport system permease protein
MKTLLQDLRYGVRMLTKSPGLTFVAVLALALGIGANSAIFSLMDSLLFRPLLVKDIDRLVLVWENNVRSDTTMDPSPANYLSWKEQSQSFEDIAGVTESSFNLSGGDRPERVGAANVSANLFPMLGVPPLLGRTFAAEEEKPGNNRVIVLGNGLWQRRFGSDPNIVGQTVPLNGENYTVIGVMPQGFMYPPGSQVNELWTPLVFSPDEMNNRAARYVGVLARLKAGVVREQAQAEMNSIARRLEQQFPATNTGMGVKLVTMREQFAEIARPAALPILFGAVGFVLLMACVNVANLLLARATTRQKEIAIRTSLGASRARLVRQLLTESLLLSLIGGALGLLLAGLGLRLIVVGTPDWVANLLPRMRETGINGRVFGFALLISILTSVIFGLVPALYASKPDLNGLLKEGRESGGRRASRLHSILVAAEVALALVLLVGAGLMVTSFIRLTNVDPGFRTDHVLTMEMTLPEGKYKEDVEVSNAYKQVVRQIETLPGVKSAGAIDYLPLGLASNTVGFIVQGAEEPAPGEAARAARTSVVTPGYFQTLNVQLLDGRLINEQDSEKSQPAIVINARMAERFWPNGDAVGKRIALKSELKSGEARWREVVGVVSDVRQTSLDMKPRPEMYLPLTQAASRSMALVIHTDSDPLGLVGSVRQEVRTLDKDQPVFNVRTMESLVSESVFAQRFSMALLSVFALIALILAAVGIYAVMSYSVAQRTHEIGIRMSLGAQQRDILKMVVGKALRLTAIGLVIGLVCAIGMTQVLASLLYGVSASDPVVFLGTSLLFASIALLASYIPASRASRVDPLVALRYE